MRKFLPVFILLSVAVFSGFAAVTPSLGVKYYILQTNTLSGKVISVSTFDEVIVEDASKSDKQQFEFIPVAGKTNVYYLKRSDGFYLINSIDISSLTEYSTDSTGTNCQWTLEGTDLNSVRFKSYKGTYLGSTAITSGSLLFADKTSTDGNAIFKLCAATSMTSNNMLDYGFENAVVEGTPLGKWINNNGKTLGNDNATTQNYRSRIINNGYQSVGNNAFILRFYGDENSYTKISHLLTGLTKGATYQFTYKYKQSNVITADATVSSYICTTANAESVSAIGSVFTSTPPTTTAATQAAQNGTLTFLAPASECYVVFAKNPSSTSNFLQYIDEMVLTKTAEATKQIYSTTTSVSLNGTTRLATMNITGVLLTDSIRISAPDGIVVTPAVLGPNVSNQTIEIEFRGFSAINSNIVFNSGEITKNIPVTVTYSTSFVQPVSGEKYYIQQRTGGKVIGKLTTGTNAGLRYAEKDDATQIFEFVKVANKTNVYNMVNNENKYLTANQSLLEYKTTPTALSEWVLQGSSDTLVYITQASNSAKVIGSDSIVNNKTLYGDRLSSAANSAFTLHKLSVLNTGYMFDPNFENCPVDGGPLGTWIPANDPIQLGLYGYSRVQGGNGWAANGKKCMYLRFLGEATSYNSISLKLFSLVKGATYRLDLQYKVQSTSATALVNIYAAATANGSTNVAIGGLYTTTSAATTNTATQPAQSASLSFVAPASSVYIVFAKNTTATNFNFFIDNLILTETKPSAIDNTGKQKEFNAFFSDQQLMADFELPEPGKAEFSVFNLNGQCIYSESDNFVQSKNTKTFRISLSSGVYILQLKQGTYTKFVKIIK